MNKTPFTEHLLSVTSFFPLFRFSSLLLLFRVRLVPSEDREALGTWFEDNTEIHEKKKEKPCLPHVNTGQARLIYNSLGVVDSTPKNLPILLNLEQGDSGVMTQAHLVVRIWVNHAFRCRLTLT